MRPPLHLVLTALTGLLSAPTRLLAQEYAPLKKLGHEVQVRTASGGFDTTRWVAARPAPGCTAELELQGVVERDGRLFVDSTATSSERARLGYADLLEVQTRSSLASEWQDVDLQSLRGQTEACSYVTYAGGLGLGATGMHANTGHETATGIVVHGRVGWKSFLLDVDVHPYAVPFPGTANSFSTANVLASAELAIGKSYYVIGGVGFQFRSATEHSATPSTEISSGGLAIGAALGKQYRVSETLTFAPELGARYAFAGVNRSFASNYLIDDWSICLCAVVAYQP